VAITIKMTDSKNVSINNASNPASNSFLIVYGNKSIELRVMKDEISMYQDSYLERKKILEEEKRKLVIHLNLSNKNCRLH